MKKDERFIIVNENDEIIGSKKRGEAEKADIYRVTGLWIENAAGDVLLAQRVFSKKNDPGKWGPAVAGTVEEGESYDDNMVKEAWEELGIENIEFQKLSKIRVFGDHNYFGQWYRVVLDWNIKKFKIENREVEQIKWFSKDELKKEFKDKPENFVSGLLQSRDVLNIS